MSKFLFNHRLSCAAILVGCAVGPAAFVQLLARAPGERTIHIEAFRYGQQPSVIRCNRGDTLHLTFSSRDTGHSFFLEEFDLDAKISPYTSDVLAFRTSDPTHPPEVRQRVTLRAEHPGWRRWLVSKSHYRCHVWCGPMHAFEHGKLIIEPNTLLYAGWGLVIGIPLAMLLALRRDGVGSLPHAPDVDERQAGKDLLRTVPLLSRLLHWRGLQYSLIFVTSVLLYVVVLTALFGTQMSGRNLGVMLTWIVWLFLLVVVLTPWGGRLWCLACPLPAVGELVQRGAVSGVRSGQMRSYKNRFFGLQLVWPRWLANGWLRMLVLLGMGVFSTALVATPRLTAVVIIVLVLMATVMACIWELRAFCRYVCPVSAFVGLYGKAAKLELRAAHASVCARCASHACEFGSERGWACPFGLRVSEIHENDHCGLCTECFKTCPHHNVTLRWRPFASEITIRHADQAWTSMTMFVLATAYVITHLGHWPVLRDYVNILDKGNWHLLAVYAAVVWSAALFGLPLLMFGLAAFGNWLSRTGRTNWEAMIASTGALIPLGLMLWIAFTIEMAMVNVSFVKQSLSDPFGWGWDFFGTGGMPWHQLWPSAIPWIQVACVLLGFAFSLRGAWRIWVELTGESRAALRGAAPLALFLIAVAGAFVRFFAD